KLVSAKPFNTKIPNKYKIKTLSLIIYKLSYKNL
ncbi:hypothetical protein BBU29805_0571, partial [Borreliella burgdorferi 29805]